MSDFLAFLATQPPEVQAYFQTLARQEEERRQRLREAGYNLDENGILIDPSTGRPAFTGPAGEAGYEITGPDDPRAFGHSVWQMPDGRWAAYDPGKNIQEGNKSALGLGGGGGGGEDQALEEAKRAQQESAKAQIADFLRSIGLDSLVDWAWKQIVAGKSNNEILLELRQHPVYKARFPYREALLAAKLPVPDERTYLEYESQVKALFREAGMPEGFYDQPQDFADLLVRQWTVPNLARRVNEIWTTVVSSPPEVRRAFGDLFGPEGDTALAMYILDPDKSFPHLERAVVMGRLVGLGRRAGFELSRETAEAIAPFAAGRDIAGGISQLTQIAPLLRETVTETTDLTPEQGLEAVFEVPGTAAAAIERRRQERLATQAGGGGAVVGSEGVGLGRAEERF